MNILWNVYVFFVYIYIYIYIRFIEILWYTVNDQYDVGLSANGGLHLTAGGGLTLKNMDTRGFNPYHGDVN